jgi:ubiquinol-cytochrome c reductase cytochrome b subunit
MFMHIFRGIFFSSFFLKGPWLSGWVILVVTIIVAFLGYVLPWGQMSFWGATVIINLLRVLPIGNILVIWLWGGFYVSYITCSFFYSLHFLLPFAILVLVISHLFFLHFSGRRAPRGLRASHSLKVKFHLLFLYKDIVNLIFFWGFWLFFIKFPDWAADPVNFLVSDLTSSPLHIQPEWYFLNLYAVLRSIPNKVGGLIGFAMALVALVFLRGVVNNQKLSHLKLTPWLFWSFVSVNFLLLWLGSQPVEAPYVSLGQVLTFVYFTNILCYNAMDLALKKLWLRKSV